MKERVADIEKMIAAILEERYEKFSEAWWWQRSSIQEEIDRWERVEFLMFEVYNYFKYGDGK